MSFELSPEHETFRKSVREFALAEIAPHAAQWDRDHHFPTDVVHKMGELGLMGLTAPEEFGGMASEDSAGDFTALCVAIEEVGRVDQSMGITLEAAVGLGINPILTPEQRRPRPTSSTASGCSTAPSSSSRTPAPTSRPW
jgi:butyryl-CoA dehydrogenase